MDKINIHFIHGWAFDHSFWIPVHNEMKKKSDIFNYYFYDQGFFGPKIVPSFNSCQSRNIFIVHSYGFNWLVKKNLKMDLIINFFGSPLFLNQEKKYNPQKRALQTMISEFQINPKYVLEKFYINCGLKKFFDINEFNSYRLIYALKKLYVENLIFQTKRLENKIYSIFSKNDKILMYRKFDDYFPNPEHRHLKVLDYSSHAMPFLKPLYCCEIIENFIKYFLKNDYDEK
ncbi:hypothetical protein OA848_03880 [Rickettsiales bacterium]|nr:hypothetical protein [Rickettsiales bacterium]